MAIKISGTEVIGDGKQFIQTKGADVASATELLVLTDGNTFDVTGTTTIATIEHTANAWAVGSRIELQFDAALTLTHHATDLILFGGADITVAAGDTATFQKIATGDWQMYAFNGISSTADWEAGTSTKPSLTSPANVLATVAALGPSEFVEFETPFDFSIDGLQTGINSTNFEDGYEYMIRVEGVKLTALATMEFGLYLDTDVAWHGSSITWVTTSGTGDDLHGWVRLNSARQSTDSKLIEYGVNTDANYTSGADDSINFLDNNGSQKAGSKMYMFATAQKIRRIRIINDIATTMKAGKIIMLRRRVFE